MVTVGRSGVGKSTLIRNMLRLTDKDDILPRCGHSPSSVTTNVEVFTKVIPAGKETVTVKMIDTPGLMALDVDDNSTVGELQVMTGGYFDLLLYCVSILPDSKIDEEDEHLIKKLTRVFGKSVWKNSVLVLTFTNAAKVLYPDQCIEDIIEDYAKRFGSVLWKGTCSESSVGVVSTFSCDPDQLQNHPSTIIALPVGYHPDEQYTDGTPGGWDVTVFDKVLKKFIYSSPVVLMANGPWASRRVRLPLEVCGFVLGTTVAWGITAHPFGLLGGYVGAAIGAVVGLFTIRFSIFSICIQHGASYGYLTGLTAIGVVTAYGVFTALQEHETEQKELEDVQNEIKRCTTARLTLL